MDAGRAVLLAGLLMLSAAARADERIVGLPCEGCYAVFTALPDTATLGHEVRIASREESGEPLTLTGIVESADGQPAAGVIVYAYQTNARGLYPRAAELKGEAARHGRLRAWARTDAQGRYTFHTIRPGSYPDSRIPQHIHLHIIEPGRCTYWIGDVLFRDDPFLSAAAAAREDSARGGNGVVTAAGDAQTGWRAQRDIVLGLNVPGYADCGA